jgi:hypothetical protein
VILALVGGFYLAYAYATDWSFFFKGNDGITYFIDKETIQVSAKTSRVWILQNTQVSSDGILSSIDLIEFGCKEGKFRFLQSTFFSDHMGTGDVLLTENANAWSYTQPGTAFSELQKIVCKNTAVLPLQIK